MPLILASNSASGGYNVANSLRFNSASSDNLSRTPSASNRKTWTFSTWIKFTRTGSNQGLLVAGASYTEFGYLGIKIGNGDYFDVGMGTGIFRRTTQLFRDVSAWYHFVVGFDTTQATASDRVKVYVNGSQITDFSISNNPTLNTDYGLNSNALTTVGRNSESAGEYFNGYMAETYYIDGQQLTPSSFGQTDPSVPSSGIWQPKAYTGTYGTNGFYLQFKNSASLGTDSSGNGNTFTVNNLTSVDQSTDTCTNNFSTLNLLANNEVPNGNTFSYSDGALTFKGSAGTDTSQMMTVGTQAVSTGKWYWEAKLISVGSDIPGIGILNTEANFNVQNAYPHNSSVSAYGYTYMSNGQKSNNGTDAAYGTSYTTGDIIGIALDMTNNKLYFSKNGTFQNSGDPTSGATGTGAAYTVQSALTYFPACNLRFYPSAGEWSFNFGSPSYAANSYTDGAGFGNFSYAVPSGYYSLNTKNLANFG